MGATRGGSWPRRCVKAFPTWPWWPAPSAATPCGPRSSFRRSFAGSCTAPQASTSARARRRRSRSRSWPRSWPSVSASRRSRSPRFRSRRPIRSAAWRWRSRTPPSRSSATESTSTSAARGAESGMARRADAFVSGLVLAAGGSRRLGQPKQLLPFDGDTLLGRVVTTARRCRFDQLLAGLGGSAAEGARREVVVNEDFGSGCASSIAAALGHVDPRADVLVLLLGDQPGVTSATVQALLDGMGTGVVAACAYANGRGHPLAFGRAMFDDLRALHGDKAVWKLLAGRADEVIDVPVRGPVPRGVDTRDDYRDVLAAAGVE